MHFIRSYNIEHEADAGLIKRKAKLIFELVNLKQNRQVLFNTAISELVRNVLMYAGSGKITFYISDATKQTQELLVIVEDKGNGITNLDEILEGNYKSKTGLGLGLTGARKLSDSFKVESSKDGTKVQLGMYLENKIHISPELIVDWLHQLKTGTSNYTDQIRDVNEELKEAYNEIQKQQNELLELNLQLEERAVALADKSEEIIDFANLVAHDLKSPLNNVTMVIEMLKEQLTEPDNQKYCEMTLLQCGKMREFIDQVLNFSKAGNEAKSLELVDLNLIIQDLLEYLEIPKNVRFFVDSLEKVEYTKSEIRMILQNLITNAIKYNENKNIEIRIWSESTSEEVKFFVKDNGIGISPENQKQLFKFGKILSELVLDESSGVGLSIVKNMIEKHGGTISVESHVGLGSTFAFTVPKN